MRGEDLTERGIFTGFFEIRGGDNHAADEGLRS